MRSSVRALLALVVVLVSACSREPSPEALEATLVKHPEVLYAAIRAHPADFLTVVQDAARRAQDTLQQRAAAAESARIDSEFVHPKHATIEHRAVLGNPSAPVTIVEYTDFQCPYCRAERDVLVRLMQHYGDGLRLVVKQLPLEIHPHARAAARMYEAVARQDPTKAYRFYDLLYDEQERLDREGEAFLPVAAGQVGVDVDRATRDASSPEVAAVVEADEDEAKRFGFDGTPGLLINGVAMQGAVPYETLVRLIDRHMAALHSFVPAGPSRPPSPVRRPV